MERNIFGDEHRAFREMVRDFVAHEISPLQKPGSQRRRCSGVHSRSR